MLWNLSDAQTSSVGRGRLQRGGKVWVAEKVTQADQGNYTLKNLEGKVLSRSTLTVRGENGQDDEFKVFSILPHCQL